VYGTDTPKYHFEYRATPADDGKFKLHMTLTQGEVGDHFGMLVPIFVDFGNGWSRIGQLGIAGKTTRMRTCCCRRSEESPSLLIRKFCNAEAEI